MDEYLTLFTNTLDRSEIVEAIRRVKQYFREKTMKAQILKIKIDREAIRRRMPSDLFKGAMYRSGAGIHADQKGRYGKRERSRNKAEERAARLR